MARKLLLKCIKELVRNNIFIIIGCFTILPFVAISIFNNPSGDDFDFNMTGTIHGYWNAQLGWYLGNCGRYITVAILSLKPLVSGSFIIYKLMPIIWLILLFKGLHYLCLQVFENLHKRDYLAITCLFFIVYLFQMPNVAEGFYWLSSSVAYQFSNILVLFLFSFLIKLIKGNKTKHLVLSVLFVFAVIGTNEASMLMVDFLLGTIFVYRSIIKRSINRKILILIISALMFTSLVGFAPGNSVRFAMSDSPTKHDIYFALSNSLIDLQRYSFIWLQIVMIWLIVFHEYFRKRLKINEAIVFKINPFFVFFVLCITVFIGFFTGNWSQGYTPPLRTINSIYFFFILGMLYFSFVLFYFLKQRQKKFITITPWVNYLLIFFLVIKLFHTNNIKTAYSELISGEAYAYDSELKERYKIINNCHEEICYVPPLKNKPATLFSRDITDSINNYNNIVYAHYWRVKHIATKN